MIKSEDLKRAGRRGDVDGGSALAGRRRDVDGGSALAGRRSGVDGGSALARVDASLRSSRL